MENLQYRQQLSHSGYASPTRWLLQPQLHPTRLLRSSIHFNPLLSSFQPRHKSYYCMIYALSKYRHVRRIVYGASLHQLFDRLRKRCHIGVIQGCPLKHHGELSSYSPSYPKLDQILSSSTISTYRKPHKARWKSYPRSSYVPYSKISKTFLTSPFS